MRPFLGDLTTKQLQAEIDSRKPKMPEPLKLNDFSRLKKLCIQYVESPCEISEEEFKDILFGVAIDSVFGSDFDSTEEMIAWMVYKEGQEEREVIIKKEKTRWMK
jgi:hypothetical protein